MLERKDVRAKLDASDHANLDAICAQKGTTHADWIESVIVPVIRQTVSDTLELADRLRKLGITGKDRE